MLFFEIFIPILFFLFLWVFFSPRAIKISVAYAPFLPTPKNAIRRALREINLKPNEKFYDLGSGTGRSLIIASREFGAKVTGFEYVTSFFIFSKINLFLRGIKDANVYRKDFFSFNLRDADVIFMFLTPKAFNKLEDKLKQELKPNTRIVTFSSPLLFWKPEKVTYLSKKHKNLKLHFYIKKS